MKDKIMVDTNVLIYIETSDEEKKHEIAIETLEKMKLEYDLFLSIQNINEFSNNMLKKSNLSHSSINEIITNYQTTFNMIFFNIETIKAANNVSREYNIHFYDALLAATMQENNIFKIITENEKDFKKVPWIKIINPFKELDK
ncbi:MAG: PIN domain-containing protein [Candidatus Micrarchaeota archaeon]|nr:PIN domain-containing protein [Candidatus Micrarchaeota archaeon]